MKKNHFARHCLALIALLTFSTQIEAQPTNYVSPIAHDGCMRVAANGYHSFTIRYDNPTHNHHGSNLFIWIAWGGNYLGPFSPTTIAPNPLGGWDYLYDISSISYLNLPTDQCYTIYYSDHSNPNYNGWPNPSHFAYSINEVCPCPVESFDIPWCSANFSYNANSSTPSTVYFTASSAYVPLNSSTYPYTSSYHWDFGDGTSSNTQNPVHNYTSTGTYNVCLTVKVLDNGEEVLSCTYCLELCINEIGPLTWPNGN